MSTASSSSSISRAVDVINNHGIIAHQTDTVIGLACLPKQHLLRRIQVLKRRERDKGFILLASSPTQVSKYIDVTKSELNKLSQATTKPTTWVVDANSSIPDALLGKNRKIAIRITQHPDVAQLCDEVGAIVSTSANLSQQQTCLELDQVRAIFGPRIDFIQSKSTPGTGQSSTIIDLNTGNVLRK